MAEEIPSLHIDTDWKKQAQEEKRRLAEQQKQGAGATATTPAPAAAAAAEAQSAPPREPTARGARDLPQASFANIVSSLMTQVLLYLGDIAPRGGEPMVNLDMARHNIDALAILEQKTKGNLTPEEQRLLDTALYDLRMRFVSVSSQFIS